MGAPTPIVWIPNAITILRIALVPVFVLLVVDGRPHAAGATLAFIAISDLLDGWIARRFRLESRLGAVLDPLADKLAQVTALVVLGTKGHPGITRIPLALLGILLARELLLLYGSLRIRARHRKVVVRPRFEGKASTFLVFCAAFASCFGAPPWAVHTLAYLAAPLILLSAVRYFLDGFRQFAGNPTRSRS